MAGEKKNEIIIPIGCEVVVRQGQAQLRVTFDAVTGTFDIRSDLPIRLYVPLGKDEQLISAPRIGEEFEHGWKYGGVSVTTGFPLFVAPKDEPLQKAWLSAMEDAAALRDFLGHNGSQQRKERDLRRIRGKDPHDHGVRLPTANELDSNLFTNRKEIGGFDESSLSSYWSSTPWGSSNSHYQRFDDRSQDAGGNSGLRLVRLVRS